MLKYLWLQHNAISVWSVYLNRTPKRHILEYFYVCVAILVEIRSRVWSVGLSEREKILFIKSTGDVIFHPFPQQPQWVDRYEIWFADRFRGRNQLFQISFWSDKGFGFYGGSNCGLSHRNVTSPLTQGLNYHSACDQWTIHRIISVCRIACYPWLTVLHSKLCFQDWCFKWRSVIW